MSVTLCLVSCTQRLSNGAIEPDSDVARVLELQNTVDKQVSLHNTSTLTDLQLYSIYIASYTTWREHPATLSPLILGSMINNIN